MCNNVYTQDYCTAHCTHYMVLLMPDNNYSTVPNSYRILNTLYVQNRPRPLKTKFLRLSVCC